jgi:DNA-binding LacI/PurR family transcriptional regulator
VASEPLTRAATMADVGRLAGVSVMTVSRVLNGSPKVSTATRDRVRSAMTRLNYKPNLMARGLVSGRSRTIGVITFDTGLYGPGAALLGIERAARERGYGVSIAALPTLDRSSLTAACDSLTERSTDGIITIAPQMGAANAVAHLDGSLPLVAVEAGPRGHAPVVEVDQRLGARIATEHLLGLGHETVWHISGPSDWFESSERIEGWREALSEAGAPAPKLLRGDWSAASGYMAAQELLKLDPSATAVFAANDQMALGFMHALYERGMTAPDPISIVGFDDIPESGFFSPSLTTVRQDFDEMGRRGVEMLVTMLEGGTIGSDRVETITPELVLRASSAAPTGRR